MIGHGGLSRVFSFAHQIRGSGGPTRRHAQTAVEMGFAMHLMLKHCCISHSSTILGSDRPKSNNRKGNSIHSRERPNGK